MSRHRKASHEVLNERGQETRLRLIEAALDVFGNHGYEGASTRQLAERAGANLAAIPYHFGGKQGLHHAVAVHIADQITTQLGPTVADLAKACHRDDLAAAEARDLLHRLLDRFVDTLLGRAEAERWARFIIREQMRPSPAFDVLYERIMLPIHGLACRLLGRLLDRPAHEPETMIRVFALIGQVVVFRVARAATQRRLDWDGFTEERLATIKAVLRSHLDAILDAGGGQ